MAALRIALLGAPAAGVSKLGAELQGAIKASGWHASVLWLASFQAHPADLGSFDLVLLMGQEAATQAQAAADQSIRAALTQAAVSYRVLYGTNGERLAHALQAVESLLPRVNVNPPQSPSSGSVNNRPWVWMCDKCSDPQCEHQLLTALLGQRARAL